jgi:hypothetical protein
MLNLNSCYIQLRNFYKNKLKKIVLIEKNDKIINNNFIFLLIQFLSFFNLSNIINYFEFGYLYKIDDMYFYYKNNSIYKKINLNIISNCNIYNNMYKINFTENIKKYNLDVPLYLIIHNESIDFHCSLEFEIMNLGKIKTKYYQDIFQIKNKKLGEII